MSQIVTIQVGGCGTKIGLSFWEQLYQNMEANKSNNHNYYYQRLISQQANGQKSPRTVFIDTDPRSEELIFQNKINFDISSIVSSSSSCKYNLSDRFKQSFQDSIRTQIQKCDLLSGFLFIHSTGGGCGSGVAEKTIDYIRSNYPYKILQQFRILPGIDFTNKTTTMSPLQVYNTVLYNNTSVQNTDLVYFMEDMAVQKILANRQIKSTNYDIINNYYGQCLNQHIHAYIQSGYLNTNQRKRATNLIPFPRMKFIAPSLSEPKKRQSIRSALDVENRLLLYRQKVESKIIALNINVRDNFIEENQINKIINAWSNHTNNQFVDWISTKVHISIQKPDDKRRESSWVLFNGWQNIEWKKQIADIFTAQHRKKAFYSHYIERGMDDMQFVEAESSLNDALSEYVIYGPYDPQDQ